LQGETLSVTVPFVEPERRAAAPSFRLAGELAVEILVPIGDDDFIALPGTVTELAGTTVTVAMADGVAALTVATSTSCMLVWRADGAEHVARVHAGRRVDDVHSPTTLELVLEDAELLAELGG
jgi:hypothetical protein